MYTNRVKKKKKDYEFIKSRKCSVEDAVVLFPPQ